MLDNSIEGTTRGRIAIRTQTSPSTVTTTPTLSRRSPGADCMPLVSRASVAETDRRPRRIQGDHRAYRNR